jgi:hypothetical protein
MFAGIPELFLILVVVFAAWHVVKMFNRASSPPPRAPRPQTPRQGQRVIEAEDLVACKACGAYIASSARHCGRADCPQPR